MLIIHTREGHRPDLSDAPKHKVERGEPSLRIGAPGPMGRILVRGEPGHDIIPELYPAPGEPVIDKPGKGAFYQTDLELMLKNREIDTLLVCGVTTEVCVNTTVREANDRGFRCIVMSDCCASYFPEFHAAGLAMIKAQGGIFGWVTASPLSSRGAGFALSNPAFGSSQQMSSRALRQNSGNSACLRARCESRSRSKSFATRCAHEATHRRHRFVTSGTALANRNLPDAFASRPFTSPIRCCVSANSPAARPAAGTGGSLPQH